MKKANNICTLILAICMISCNDEKSNKTIVITDFSKSQTFTLTPNNSKSYSAFIIKIQGETNDSISIFKNQFVKLNGKIDTTFSIDYYGGNDAVFFFHPYKSTKGKLLIKMKIQ